MEYWPSSMEITLASLYFNNNWIPIMIKFIITFVLYKFTIFSTSKFGSNVLEGEEIIFSLCRCSE